jgi:RNase P/RNase MRP subunit POP5
LVRLVRRRYIAFKLNCAPFISKRELLAIFMEKIAAKIGKEGSEIYNIRIIEYDLNTGIGIVRCNHRALGLLLSVLRDSTEAFGKYSIETQRVSGSIKTLKRKLSIEMH